MNNNSYQKKDNEVYTPEVFSAYRFFNSNSEIDNTAISISYWNSLLKISIMPIIVKEGSNNKIDTENHVDIYLSVPKAKMLLNCIRQFRQDPDKYMNIGVNTNKGLIYIANGANMFGKGGTLLVINIIDNESGAKISEAAYEFNREYYAIVDYNGGSDFSKDKSYAENIELDMLESVLEQYVFAYTNAIASSVIHCNRFNDDREFSFIKDVRDKLGIAKTGSGKNYNKSNWFNDNGGNSSSSSSSAGSNSASYDEVINDIGSIMD